jgi:alpha-beta hydrolase superfamily lysophospholipase
VKFIAMLVLCAGCAGGKYVEKPRPAVSYSADVKHGEGTFEGFNKFSLFEQWWKPAAGEPKAVLVIVHGLKDHSTRYGEFAARLAEHGYEVRAFDLRGHGSSEGRRVLVDSFDEYVSDLDTFVKRARVEGKPFFVLGHSMGGAIVTDWVLTRKPALTGMILSAPALKADVNWFTSGSVSFMGTVFPLAAIFSLDLDKFSRDPNVVAQCKADPLVDQGNGPARTARELLKTISYIGEHMEEVEVPFLDMHGSADVITEPDGSRELVRRARSTDKTLKIYEGLFHDLLHEPEKEQVMKDVSDWMDAHVK